MIKWKRKGKDIEDFKSFLPMPRDATVSFAQFYSAISRDKNVARSVNMIPQRDLNDAYMSLRVAVDKVAEELDDNNPTKKYLYLPEDIYSHAKRRKSVKSPLMIWG